MIEPSCSNCYLKDCVGRDDSQPCEHWVGLNGEHFCYELVLVNNEDIPFRLLELNLPVIKALCKASPISIKSAGVLLLQSACRSLLACVEGTHEGRIS